jgi:hypothetical protein
VGIQKDVEQMVEAMNAAAKKALTTADGTSSQQNGTLKVAEMLTTCEVCQKKRRGPR